METVEAFGGKWQVRYAKDWESSGSELRLLVARQPEAGQPRRPQQPAVLEGPALTKVTIDLEMKPGGRSLILIYAYQGPAHYNYVHISSDEARRVAVHNGVFHCFGGERVRISSLEGPASFDGNSGWTPVRLVFDGETGRCHAEVNGRRNPSLEAVDLSLRSGRVGLGSFNETGAFRNWRVTSGA